LSQRRIRFRSEKEKTRKEKARRQISAGGTGRSMNFHCENNILAAISWRRAGCPIYPANVN